MYACDVMCMHACVVHVQDTFQGVELHPSVLHLVQGAIAFNKRNLNLFLVCQLKMATM